MDPIITGLATFVANTLAEYLKKEGQPVFGKAKELLAILRNRWADDGEALENLERYIKKPRRYQPVLEDILKEKLVVDKALCEELTRLYNEDGGVLDIDIKMKSAEEFHGLEANEFIGGTVIVRQATRDISGSVTGVNIHRLG